MKNKFWHSNHTMIKRTVIAAFIFILFTGSGVTAFAKGGGTAPSPSVFSDPLALTLLFIIAILLLAILLLANVVRGGMDIYRNKMTERKDSKTTAVTITLILLSSSSLYAGDAGTVSAPTPVTALSETVFMFLAGVIVMEMVVILGLLYSLRILLGIERKRIITVKPVKVRKPANSFWEKFNRLKPLEEEHQIDLGHNYDGIKELDNRLPPWWLYGFYASILFAIIYLWRFQVTHDGPSPLEEYTESVRLAELEKTSFLAISANNVDETTVVLATSKEEIESGKTIFQASCSPCHGKEAEGVVGPNLVDDYWMHGGNIKDIFKTIKYGVPDKGMRSWKDEFSPKQIAQLSSYIRTLRGTNPPNAKAKQGDLYVENDAPRSAQDSSVLKKTQ